MTAINNAGRPTLSIPEALVRLNDARKAGCALLTDELVILATAVEKGFESFPADRELSCRLIDQAAAEGHPQAMVIKAVRLIDAAGGEETPEAMALIKQAAEKGEPESIFNIGVEIITDTEDIDRGFRLIADSAERGYGKAIFQLALAYKLGTLCPANDILARFYELMALDADAPGASESINHFFEDGSCLNQDGELDRAKIIDDACQLNEPAALFAWFCYHIEKQIDNPDANALAFDRLKRAAEMQYSPACMVLVDFNDYDPDERFRILNYPCQQHFPKAMSAVGRMIFNGEGTSLNRDEGFKLINQALNFNDPDAMAFIVESTRSGLLPDPTGGAREAIYAILCRDEFMDEASRMMVEDDTKHES